jgi:hypothetical protein
MMPTVAEVAALVALGLSDVAVGRHFGRTDQWAQKFRKKHAIASAYRSQATIDAANSGYDVRPESPETRRTLAAFHARAGRYTDIAPRRRSVPVISGSLLSVTRAVLGDPAPGRAA